MVLSRVRSIEWKFPLLMSGFVLGAAALFLLATYNQFTGTLYHRSGERLRAASLLVSGLISEGVPRTEGRLVSLASEPAIVTYLATGSGRNDARADLDLEYRKAQDPALWRIELLDRKGSEKMSAAFHPGPWSDWARSAVARNPDSINAPAYGPFFGIAGVPQYDVIAPVRSGEQIVGYIVDTRAAVGTGQNTIRRLIGDGSKLLIGAPGGAWTDLEKLVPGPPAFPANGSPVIFDRAGQGSGIGVGVRIARTPWFLWLEQPDASVQAPVREFVVRMIPEAAIIAVTAALMVWLLTRSITLRIARLTKEADRLEAADEESSEHGERSPDEIDRLCAAFERMAERIRTNRDLEAQLRQAQKLEAIGRLAGGVAHDFNNILTVVRNYGEMIRDALPPKSELAQDMQEILRAADRANALTAQLLSFSRRQVLNTRVLRVNDIVEASERMLQRVLPANIKLVTILDPDVGSILADAGQIEQVLLNLTINAADAMPDGGLLTIHTRNAHLDATLPPPNGVPSGGYKALPAGTYASIVVTDTGIGMDRETVSKIFDPFFTTKPVGKGTGLGLATVHGIVTQNKGSIWVYSERGRGTTFKIYFPIVGVQADVQPTPKAKVPELELKRPTETILIVEDDPSTRKVTQRVLAKAGYMTLEATNGDDALELIENYSGRIDLVLTDLMMPGVGGIELASRLATLKPDLPVIFMSGYAEHTTLDRNVIDANRPFIEKPFTAAGLLALVRSELGAGAVV
jgi:signal transduction histidine kinase/ActR/RegA family two-component response regulator